MHLTLTKKGQGIAIDFLFAVLVFLLVLNASLTLIDKNNLGVMDKNILNDLHSRATQTLDMLIRTSGQPNDWYKKTIDEVTVIGLAKRDRALETVKVEKFVEWAQDYGSVDYNKSKTLLLIGYDYRLKISDSDDFTLYQIPKILPSSWDNMVAINIKRIVNLDGDEVIVEFTIYYPRR